MGLLNWRAAKQHVAAGGSSYFENAPNTPPSVYDAAAGKFAEIYGSSRVDATRWFLVALACIVLALIAVISMATVFPLKEVRPWIVEVNGSTGVVNKPVEVLRLDPNTAVIKSELGRWLEAVYGIDPLRSRDALRWANTRVADKAVGQFAEFRARERVYDRMNREPDLIRSVQVSAVDVSQKGTAFAFLTTTERTGLATPSPDKTKRYRVTINYKLLAPTQESQMMANPLGLYVTFFSDTEERAQ